MLGSSLQRQTQSRTKAGNFVITFLFQPCDSAPLSLMVPEALQALLIPVRNLTEGQNKLPQNTEEESGTSFE